MQSMASTLSLFAPTILNHSVLKTSEFSEVFKLFPKIRILDKNNPSIQKMARGTSEMVSRVDSAIDHGILRATRDLDFQLGQGSRYDDPPMGQLILFCEKNLSALIF